MSNKIIKEKEKQEIFFLLISFVLIFVALMWLTPPSFDFSVPEPQPKEGKNYHEEIKGVMERIDFGSFERYEPIPPLEEDSGRENPFMFLDWAPEEIGEEEMEEFVDFQ